ncbi:unnamed protein product, partial [Ectocarpus sp. 13 AM-2016]
VEGQLIDAGNAKTGNEGEGETTNDSPISVAKLHLALESLCQPLGSGKIGNLQINECAQFCEAWQRDCPLPAFFDRALLEPVWSVVEK